MAIDDFRTQADAMRGLLGNLGVTDEDYINADKAKVKAARDSVEADLAADPLVAPQHYTTQIKDEKGTFGLLKDAFFGEMKGPLAAMFAPDYVEAKQNYAVDLAAYGAAEKERLKLGVMDPQVEAHARIWDEIDPVKASYIRAANAVDAWNGNDYTLGQGQTRFSGFDDSVVARGAAKDGTAQMKNLQEYQEIMAREPADKASPEWKAWKDELTFFETSVRANINDKGIIRSGQSGQARGPVSTFVDESSSMASGVAGAEQAVESADRMFNEGYTRVRESAGQVRDYDDRIEVAEDTLHKFETGEYDTNMVRGMILNITGLGSMEDAEVRALGTDEAINKVTNFNGHTTDFEYGEAFKAAFADILSGSNVNMGTLTVVIEGLKRGQEQAYQDWRGGVADMVSNAQTPGERVSLERQNTFNKRRYPKAPGLGTKEDGMMYVGGDPGNPDNWLQVK